MTNVSQFPLQSEEEDAVQDPTPVQPKPFVKMITTPAGLPWDQIRAARLEARVGAPLPLAQLAYQLRRLEGWNAGRPGRFVAAYIRSGEVKDTLRTTADVDGRPLAFTFYSPREQQRRIRSLLLTGTATGLATALLLIGIGSAVRSRLQAEAALANLEQVVNVRGREVEALDARKREARALDEAGASGRALTDFLNDLAWASNAKAPDARIQALHWDRGYLAVEARGEAPPFAGTDRHVERSAKPIKRGVWLWGVAPEGAR
jgi:hypothetical protein